MLGYLGSRFQLGLRFKVSGLGLSVWGSGRTEVKIGEFLRTNPYRLCKGEPCNPFHNLPWAPD